MIMVLTGALFLQTGCQESTTEGPKVGTSKAIQEKPVTPTVEVVERAPVIPQNKGTETKTVAPSVNVVKPKPKPRPVRVDKKKAKIEFEKKVHNFGEIAPRTSNKCEFEFKNTGDALLKISRIKSSCGCTVPTLKKKDYAPGESGVIKVTYRGKSTVGTDQRYIFVYSNDKEKPSVKLTVKARTVKKVTFKPGSLKFFIDTKDSNTTPITFTSVDDKPFAITNFKSSPAGVTAVYDPSVKAASHVIKPIIDVEKLKRSISGSITVNLDHPQCRNLKIPFKIVPKFKLTPSSSLIIRNAEPLKIVNRVIWIISNYGEDFEVESASSKEGLIKVLNRKKVGKRYKLELEITPPELDSASRLVTDALSIKIKDEKELNVTCRVFYKRKRSRSR